MPIIIYNYIVNYLITNEFIGGVNGKTSQFIEKLHLLLYVTKRLFITPITLFDVQK